jgi:hypothetical protein
MVNFRRQHIQVKPERRTNTRIEFHLPVVILGVDDKAKIIDFGLEGFHIQRGNATDIAIGRHINLALRFPSEKDVFKIKAKVIYIDETGIGCQFVNLTPQLYEALERCFDIFNATLPIE